MIVRVNRKHALHFDAMRQTPAGVSNLIDYWKRAVMAMDGATQAELARILPPAACVLRALLPEDLEDRWSACERILEARTGRGIVISPPGSGHVPTLKLIRDYEDN